MNDPEAMDESSGEGTVYLDGRCRSDPIAVARIDEPIEDTHHRASLLILRESNPRDYMKGLRLSPHVVEVFATAVTFPFANDRFLINRKEERGTGGKVRNYVTITTTIPPTEYSCWAAYSPPEPEIFDNLRLDYDGNAVRSIVVKGTRVNHFLQKSLAEKQEAGKLDSNEVAFLENFALPQGRFAAYYWLFVFGDDVVFNNTCSQKMLERTIGSSVIRASDAKPSGWSPIRNDIKTGIIQWSIDEMDPYALVDVRGQNLTDAELDATGF